MKSFMLLAAAIASASLVSAYLKWSHLWLLGCECCRPWKGQARQDGEPWVSFLKRHYHFHRQELRVRHSYPNNIYFRELILKNPRPYDVVVVYTVSQQCDLCEEVLSEYASVVYSFQKNKDKVQRPVFFGTLYYSKENHKFFLQHGFKTVPHITVSL